MLLPSLNACSNTLLKAILLLFKINSQENQLLPPLHSLCYVLFNVFQSPTMFNFTDCFIHLLLPPDGSLRTRNVSVFCSSETQPNAQYLVATYLIHRKYNHVYLKDVIYSGKCITRWFHHYGNFRVMSITQHGLLTQTKDLEDMRSMRLLSG